jgi:hypothetical protein
MNLQESDYFIRPTLQSRQLKPSSTWIRRVCLLLVILTVSQTRSTVGCCEPAPQNSRPAVIPAKEFSRIIQDVSESDGFFQSDVFVSNEIAYLTVIEELQRLGATGGAYIGVGPEQNFTYIAKIRPQIAFILDIRRQAVIQHLMYKAIFQVCADRAHFLSFLLSRPLPSARPLARDATAAELTDYLSSAPANTEAYESNRTRIIDLIQKDLQFPLNDRDRASLDYVFGTFRDAGLSISSRSGTRGAYFPRFPTLKELIEQSDPSGKPGNFLAREEDYRFVRELHLQNRIIPIVGDFAGPKALKGIGEYLRKNAYSITAFYTSNVEQYLFRSGTFNTFAANVKTLPTTKDSLFIRSAMRMPPNIMFGFHGGTLLQRITDFVKDFDEGIYTDYRRLVDPHPITK